jgi:hypothetical protein
MNEGLTMLVTIDTDQLVRDAATMLMDREHMMEKACIVSALQMQLKEQTPLLVQVRQQVKEYKKLTMWRD